MRIDDIKDQGGNTFQPHDVMIDSFFKFAEVVPVFSHLEDNLDGTIEKDSFVSTRRTITDVSHTGDSIFETDSEELINRIHEGLFDVIVIVDVFRIRGI